MFRKCARNSGTNTYLLRDWINLDNVDEVYLQIERQSVIFLSRNRGMFIFRGNTVSNNIGLYGGVINIDSPDWETGSSPYVILRDNYFTQNMAYLAGNVLYMRNTILAEGRSEICGGLSIANDYYYRNIGLKKHNGGAIATTCTDIQGKNENAGHSSTYIDIWIVIDYIMDGVRTKELIEDLVD